MADGPAARDRAGSPSPGPGLPAAARSDPAATPTGAVEAWPEAEGSLLPLFAWLSPAFPVGAYAYSHALEWAVEAGDIASPKHLRGWLEDLFAHGFARSDAILLAHARAAAMENDGPALQAVNDLAVALAPSAELRLETCQQGRSFLDAVAAAWPAPRIAALAPALQPEAAYPVALGLACAGHAMALSPVLEAFLLALAQNLVSAAVRLAPIGQTAGTQVVAALAPLARRLAAEVPALTLDDVGTATFRADLGSFRHETQYTRLFRS
ncbi:urease accessory protein UreF [Xanthobacter sediminis]